MAVAKSSKIIERMPTTFMRCHLRLLIAFVSALCVSCSPFVDDASNSDKIHGYRITSVERGKASWYSVRTNGGTHTASGKRLDDQSATAAHRTLKMGTKVMVTNEINGRSEIVTINNRGPHVRGRIIDVTIGVAERLGFRQRGIAPVKVEVIADAQ